MIQKSVENDGLLWEYSFFAEGFMTFYTDFGAEKNRKTLCVRCR